MEENPQRRAHTSNLPPKLCGAAQSAASPADRCALLPGPPAAKGKLMSAAGAFSFAPGRPPNPSVPKRRGEPRLVDTCGRGPADPQEPGRRASRWQDRCEPAGGRGGGRVASLPCAPHHRPPPNPFTKQEPQGRKGGEAGGEDGGRKGGGVSGKGAAGPAAGKPRDAAALSPPPGTGHGARTARGAGWGQRGIPGALRARVLCAIPTWPTSPKLPAGPGLTVPPAARAPVLSRPAAAPCPSSHSSPPPRLAPGCSAAAAARSD